MGMGHGCNFAEVIDEKTVEKFCPATYNALTTAIEASDNTWDDLAQAVRDDDFEGITDAVLVAFAQLQAHFGNKTGLELSMGYHNCDDQGDRYDEVDGIFWTVEGMYQLTKAGKALEAYVSRKFWVTFG